MTKDINTHSGAAEPDNVTRLPAWSLGYIDGNWRDIDHQDHDGVMRIVWQMEGEERTRECEALAHAVIAALNGVADHDGLAGQILRSGGTSGRPGKYFARAAQVADRAIESCPELNMSNYDEVDVDRLNDWAIRAHDEIRRLHTESEMRRAALLDEMQKAALAAAQATAAPADTNTTSGAADLLDLIEAYAEARHRQGHSSYNAQTAAALQAVKDELAAGQATAAQAVVPAEWPTNGMIDAGRKAAASQGRLLGSGQSLWHVFRAMIAAAPAQPAVQQALQSEDLSDYGAQLLEENGRKVLSYWPYCSKCRQPFEFEKDEPFASCGCPGSTEWGDPRPASWVQPPTATKAIQELGATTRGK